jgi:hypothetical protein
MRGELVFEFIQLPVIGSGVLLALRELVFQGFYLLLFGLDIFELILHRLQQIVALQLTTDEKSQDGGQQNPGYPEQLRAFGHAFKIACKSSRPHRFLLLRPHKTALTGQARMTVRTCGSVGWNAIGAMRTEPVSVALAANQRTAILNADIDVVGVIG